jgi:hypothetical protein
MIKARTNTCSSDFSTGTRTDFMLILLNNGEVNPKELDRGVEVLLSSKSDRNAIKILGKEE